MRLEGEMVDRHIRLRWALIHLWEIDLTCVLIGTPAVYGWLALF